MNLLLKVTFVAVLAVSPAQKAMADNPDQTAAQFGEVMAIENFCNRSMDLAKTAFDEWLAASQFEAVDKSRLRAKFLSGYQQARSELLEKLDFDRCEAGVSGSVQKLKQLSR